MDIKSLIAAEDVLTSELESIYGGNEPVDIVRRYNQKRCNVPYDPCPINEDDFLSLMEINYMKENEK